MDSIKLILTALVTIGVVVWLIHLLARRISRRLGERVANRSLEDNRRPLIRSGFILALLLTCLGYYGLWSVARSWPPAWLERRTHRNAVFQRVEQGGGWERLAADAAMLAATNAPTTPVQLFGNTTNIVLPASIALLRPFLIEVHPGLVTNAVLFRVFPGYRRHPSYSLVVVSTPVETQAQVAFRERLARTATVRQVALGVFEVY